MYIWVCVQGCKKSIEARNLNLFFNKPYKNKDVINKQEELKENKLASKF